MNQVAPVAAPERDRLRSGVLVVVVVATVGIVVELATSRHWHGGIQLIPWFAAGLLLVASVAFSAAGHAPWLFWVAGLLPLIKGLTERSQSGMPLFIVYPMFLCMPAVDCTAYYLVFPTGPETSQVLLRLCVPQDTAAALKSDAELQAGAAEYYRNIETFVAEDNEIAKKQQRGLRSRRAVPGRYSKREFLLFKYHDWLRQHVYSHLGSAERSDVIGAKEV